MNIDLISREDLKQFRTEILDEIARIVTPKTQKQWLRSSEVTDMLNISSGTLQNLRLTGKLPFKKVNGTLFYAFKDIEMMMNSTD